MYVYVYIYTHTYTHIYVYIYTYTHTHLSPRAQLACEYGVKPRREKLVGIAVQKSELGAQPERQLRA